MPPNTKRKRGPTTPTSNIRDYFSKKSKIENGDGNTNNRHLKTDGSSASATPSSNSEQLPPPNCSTAQESHSATDSSEHSNVQSEKAHTHPIGSDPVSVFHPGLEFSQPENIELNQDLNDIPSEHSLDALYGSCAYGLQLETSGNEQELESHPNSIDHDEITSGRSLPDFPWEEETLQDFYGSALDRDAFSDASQNLWECFKRNTATTFNKDDQVAARQFLLRVPHNFYHQRAINAFFAQQDMQIATGAQDSVYECMKDPVIDDYFTNWAKRELATSSEKDEHLLQCPSGLLEAPLLIIGNNPSRKGAKVSKVMKPFGAIGGSDSMTMASIKNKGLWGSDTLIIDNSCRCEWTGARKPYPESYPPAQRKLHDDLYRWLWKSSQAKVALIFGSIAKSRFLRMFKNKLSSIYLLNYASTQAFLVWDEKEISRIVICVDHPEYMIRFSTVFNASIQDFLINFAVALSGSRCRIATSSYTERRKEAIITHYAGSIHRSTISSVFNIIANDHSQIVDLSTRCGSTSYRFDASQCPENIQDLLRKHPLPKPSRYRFPEHPLQHLVALLSPQDTAVNVGTGRRCKTDGCRFWPKPFLNGLCGNCGPKCEVSGCINPQDVPGLCQRHLNSLQCRTEGCAREAKPSTGLCSRCGPRCTIAGCKNSQFLFGLCEKHARYNRCKQDGCSGEANFRGWCDKCQPTCKVNGCSNKTQADSHGLCHVHVAKTCHTTDCTNPALYWGHCRSCIPTCLVEGCKNKSATMARGLCRKHDGKLCKTPGCTLYPAIAGFCRRCSPKCAVEGCDRQQARGGLCSWHSGRTQQRP